MEPRIYHGDIHPEDFARALVAKFNQGNLRAQQLGDEEKLIVQITTSQMRRSGGNTAISVILQKVEDGVAVTIGKQAWLGVAASLGQTALAALRILSTCWAGWMTWLRISRVYSYRIRCGRK